MQETLNVYSIPQNYQAAVSSQVIKAGGIKITIERFRNAEKKKPQKTKSKERHARYSSVLTFY